MFSISKFTTSNKISQPKSKVNNFFAVEEDDTDQLRKEQIEIQTGTLCYKAIEEAREELVNDHVRKIH